MGKTTKSQNEIKRKKKNFTKLYLISKEMYNTFLKNKKTFEFYKNNSYELKINPYYKKFPPGHTGYTESGEGNINNFLPPPPPPAPSPPPPHPPHDPGDLGDGKDDDDKRSSGYGKDEDMSCKSGSSSTHHERYPESLDGHEYYFEDDYLLNHNGNYFYDDDSSDIEPREPPLKMYNDNSTQTDVNKVNRQTQTDIKVFNDSSTQTNNSKVNQQTQTSKYQGKNASTQTEHVKITLPIKEVHQQTQTDNVTISLPKKMINIGVQTIPETINNEKYIKQIKKINIKIPKTLSSRGIQTENVGITIPSKPSTSVGTQTEQVQISFPETLNQGIKKRTENINLQLPRQVKKNTRPSDRVSNSQKNSTSTDSKTNRKRPSNDFLNRGGKKQGHSNEKNIEDDVDMNEKKEKEKENTFKKGAERRRDDDIPKVRAKPLFKNEKVRIIDAKSTKSDILIDAILSSNHKNAYDVLKLSKYPPISLTALKKRFNYLSKLIHPDKTMSKKAHEAFILARSAYLDILREINYRDRNPQSGNGIFKKWFKF